MYRIVDVVSCGTVHIGYSMVWYGMVWNEMVWYGMGWNGMGWNGMGWNGMVSTRKTYGVAVLGWYGLGRAGLLYFRMKSDWVWDGMWDRITWHHIACDGMLHGAHLAHRGDGDLSLDVPGLHAVPEGVMYRN